MSITINYNYEERLRNAQPIFFGQEIVKPPPGSMASPRIIPPLVIPPLNTNIDYNMVKPLQISQHPGLMDISTADIPPEFNWRHNFHHDTKDIRKKRKLIAKPGNQMLCGSCWAIAGAGITGDNFVVSGVVDWVPNLSTTWSLVCYPQLRCKGGNPAVLFKNFASTGIVTNHCMDYSWCATNDKCNGTALKHFKKGMDMNKLLPTSCGCITNDEHYLYKLDKNISSIFIGSPGVTKKNVHQIVKKQIRTRGPVLGSFLVFKNFMKGRFAHMNGGVYLENGVYSGDTIKFDKKQVDSNHYMGSHAIAIIGWGVAKGIQTIDGKHDVPYWYCRNSWGTKWGDGGYFKFAMYPWNKRSVFEDRVTINNQYTGGIVFISASKKPIKKRIQEIQKLTFQLKESQSYYAKESHYKGSSNSGGESHYVKGIKIFLIVIGIIIGCVLFFSLLRKIKLPHLSLGKGKIGRKGSY